MNPRYEAREENPPYVWDWLERKVSSTHITFESAQARAYVLNQFSTGQYAHLGVPRLDSAAH